MAHIFLNFKGYISPVKMPTLDWIGKEAVVNHDKEVPFRLLKKIKSASVGENSQNLIIHGDNLEALKALMPYYQGRVKCIYIDPPYNTGNESWVYNDKVNSPKIKKWLGKVVGSEAEDLCRHDKWLCMMYPRLKLLQELLSEAGIIFISIDDNEQPHLKSICDDIFGRDNFIATYIWESRSGKGATAKHVVNLHEYVVCYAKNSELAQFKKDVRIKEGGNFSDEKSEYSREQLRQWGQGDKREDRPTMYFPVIAPDGKEVYPIKDDGTEGRWRISKKSMEELIRINDVDFVFDGNRYQLYRKVRAGKISKTAMGTFIFGVGTASTGTIELKSLFGDKVFDTAKPVGLIRYLLQLAEINNDEIILDSFAGSGTTGHAVLALNKEDKGNRKFILIELEDKVAKDITAERVKKAKIKYEYNDGFEFCELDKPLFNEDGQIEEECSFEQLATYIYFTETNTNLDRKTISGKQIGEFNDTQYFLLFKEKGKNVLHKKFLKSLPKDGKKKVIYADKCLIDDRTLEKFNIQFKQIPYEVKVY